MPRTPKLSGKGAVSPAASPKRRPGRDATTKRILDAAEELFASRNPSAVTMRQIAETAGVNHSLIHQYVGSKADVFNAVIQRTEADRQHTISEHPSLREVMPLLFGDVFVRKMETLAVVRSAMDGVEYTSLQQRITTGEILVKLAEASVDVPLARADPLPAVDPRMAIAASVALTYGWVALEPWLTQVFDLADQDPTQMHQQVAQMATALTELAFPTSIASCGSADTGRDVDCTGPSRPWCDEAVHVGGRTEEETSQVSAGASHHSVR